MALIVNLASTYALHNLARMAERVQCRLQRRFNACAYREPLDNIVRSFWTYVLQRRVKTEVRVPNTGSTRIHVSAMPGTLAPTVR